MSWPSTLPIKRIDSVEQLGEESHQRDEADFQVSLEHTASLFEENTDIHRQPAERLANLGSEQRPRARHETPASSRPRDIGQPPDPNLGSTTSDPNVGLSVMGSPAAVPREHRFQRVWPRIMIGVMFVLEVVWIGFLAYSSIKFIRLYF
jgi:hypothetical protein